MVAIRGAICAQNTVHSVDQQSCKLFDEMVCKNNLSIDDVFCIIFTVTKDIDVAYPAKFVREKYPQLSNVAIVCCQEMNVVDSLQNCIRVCVLCNSGAEQSKVTHCYLDGAERLRPDLKRV